MNSMRMTEQQLQDYQRERPARKSAGRLNRTPELVTGTDARGGPLAGSRLPTPGILLRNPPASKRGMQKRKGPNKTEAAFGAWLRLTFPGDTVGFECMTLRMPGGTRYTPDWMVAATLERTIELYEVKGFMREAARVRLKEFAAHFTMFRFFLVRAQDRRLLSWDITELWS